MSATPARVARHDLFLSYRRLDDAHAAPLVAALRRRGITVWQDTEEIAPFTSIPATIRDNLPHVRALLVWYSKDYNASRACQWELTAAYCAAEASGGDPCQRVLVINPEPSRGHIKLPKLVDQLHLNAGELSTEVMADEIVSRLRNVPPEPLGRLRTFDRPAWHGSAGLGSTRFVGRLGEMWEVHAKLQAGSAAMLVGAGGAGRPGITQVRGSGGMGKSLLAEEYALRFGAAYPGGVFWLRAYGYSDSEREIDPALREAQRDSQVRTIAMELGLNPHGLETPQVRGLLRQHFQGIGQPFLWIVDDLPPIKHTDELNPWLAPHELGRTLITTRARLVESVKLIDLQQLEPDEALRLLTRGQALPDEDAATARAICAELGCHALAIDVTAALIRRRGYAKVLENLRQPDRDALEFAATQFREALPNGHERSIAATLLASLRELDEPARDLLRLASVLAAAPIPRELQWRSLQYINDKKFHINNLLPRLFKKFRATRSAADIQDMTDSAAAQLIDTSLADDAGSEGFSIHTLIARTIRFSEEHSKKTTAIRTAAISALLTEMPRASDIRHHSMIKNLISHAQHIGESLENEDATNLLGWVGRYYLEQGQYNQSQSIYSLQLERRKRSLGVDDTETLATMNNLAGALEAQGNRDKARQLQLQAVDLIGKKLGFNHPKTLSIMNNLAVTLANQGEAQKSQELLQKVIEAKRKSLGEDHPDTVRSILNLGQALHQNNDLDGAISCTEQACNAMQRTLGTDHPHTLTAMGNLGMLLHEKGDLSQAIPILALTFHKKQQLLGERHSDTTLAAWNYFRVLQDFYNNANIDPTYVRKIFTENLVWLTTQEKTILSDVQRQISEMVEKEIPTHIASEAQAQDSEQLEADLRKIVGMLPQMVGEADPD